MSFGKKQFDKFEETVEMKLILEIAQVEIVQKHQKHKITGFGKTPLVAQRQQRHLHKLNARIFNSTQKQIYYA